MQHNLSDGEFAPDISNRGLGKKQVKSGHLDLMSTINLRWVNNF